MRGFACSRKDPRTFKLDRPSAIKFIRRRLAEAKIDRHTARVDRYIRCYWVAQLLGGKAEELSFCSIREMQPLIGRDCATEQWRILTAYAGAATALWARMLAEKLSVNEVRAEVRKILPARSLPIRKRKIKFAALLKAVSVISREERTRLSAAAKKLTPGARNRPLPSPSIGNLNLQKPTWAFALSAIADVARCRTRALSTGMPGRPARQFPFPARKRSYAVFPMVPVVPIMPVMKLGNL